MRIEDFHSVASLIERRNEVRGMINYAARDAVKPIMDDGTVYIPIHIGMAKALVRQDAVVAMLRDELEDLNHKLTLLGVKIEK